MCATLKVWEKNEVPQTAVMCLPCHATHYSDTF